MSFFGNFANLVHDQVRAALAERESCSVMLTGGRSAAELYRAWAAHPGFRRLSGVHFFFGDERAVPPGDAESNCGMAMRTLFREGVPAGCTLARMEAESADVEQAADRYAELLPERIDVLLLGLGEDGHVASLFPHAPALRETARDVVPVVGPRPPHRRLTVTPGVIRRARAVIVLAGPAKAHVREQALSAPDDVDSLPARLVLGARWLL